MLPTHDRPGYQNSFISGMRLIIHSLPIRKDENGNEGFPVTIYDLSPYTVKRHQLGLMPSCEGVTVEVLGEQDIHSGSFLVGFSPISSSSISSFHLPAIKIQTKELHMFDSAMIDGDNIILIKVRIFSLVYLFDYSHQNLLITITLWWIFIPLLTPHNSQMLRNVNPSWRFGRCKWSVHSFQGFFCRRSHCKGSGDHFLSNGQKPNTFGSPCIVNLLGKCAPEAASNVGI